MTVRIAVQLHPQHASWEALRETAVTAEEMGPDLLYTWDHFYPLYGDPDGEHFECWTLLAAWAEVTSTIEIGPLVSCNSYRNPQLLADMARTVDHISGGRLVFGIGSGWFQRDYDEYGFTFGTARSRLETLEEALPAIKARWSRLNPPPVRRPPILIGGGGEQITLRLAAQHADVWHYFPDDPEEMAHKSKVLDEWCETVGRDPVEVERSAGVHAENVAVDLALADRYHELGVRQFTLGFTGPDYDLSPVGDWLEWRDQVNRSPSRNISRS
ncbi:MAG: LLM class F420-dependent oxidoreductase [Acidimicrobiia bacterium]